MADAKKKPAAGKPRAKKPATAPDVVAEPRQITAPKTLDPTKNYRVTCHDRVVYARGDAASGIAAELTRLYEYPAKVEEA